MGPSHLNIMAEENANLDASNKDLDELDVKLEETDLEPSDDDSDEVKALKEKLKGSDGRNKNLFARAKKGEGFTFDDEKKEWVKKEEKTQENPQPKKEPAQGLSEEDIDKRLEERFEKRELDILQVSDDFRTEIGNYAKLNGVSIAQAMETPYIKFRAEEFQKADDLEKASLGGGGGGTAKVDPGTIEPEKLDLKSEEGQKKFKEWEDHISEKLG